LRATACRDGENENASNLLDFKIEILIEPNFYRNSGAKPKMADIRSPENRTGYSANLRALLQRRRKLGNIFLPD
jgi:hypothetical protein